MITTNLRASGVATTHTVPSGGMKSPGAIFALRKGKQNLTNAASGAGGRLSPPPSGCGPGARAGAVADTEVPSPRGQNPRGAAAALKGRAVKVTGGLWGRAEWAPGDKQALNFQLGLDLPGGVWPVCKGADEAFSAFGWVGGKGRGRLRV